MIHEFHMFVASVGIGMAIGYRWGLPPFFVGALCGGVHSLLVLLGY